MMIIVFLGREFRQSFKMRKIFLLLILRKFCWWNENVGVFVFYPPKGFLILLETGWSMVVRAF